MHKPTKEEIETVLQSHAEWLKGNSKGKRADFSNMDLTNANLFGANLSCTYLNKFKGNRYLIVSNHLPDCAPTELDLDRIIQKSYNFHCNYDDYLKLVSELDTD